MSENWDDHADGWDNNQGVNIYANKAFETLQNADKQPRIDERSDHLRTSDSNKP